jgi:hypothetical protein
LRTTTTITWAIAIQRDQIAILREAAERNERLAGLTGARRVRTPRDRSVDLGVVERVREDPLGKERQRQAVASA